jgi:hypothetical protein
MTPLAVITECCRDVAGLGCIAGHASSCPAQARSLPTSVSFLMNGSCCVSSMCPAAFLHRKHATVSAAAVQDAHLQWLDELPTSTYQLVSPTQLVYSTKARSSTTSSLLFVTAAARTKPALNSDILDVVTLTIQMVEARYACRLTRSRQTAVS